MAHGHQQMRKTNEALTITLGALVLEDVVGTGGQAMAQNGYCTSTTILARIDGLTAGEGGGLMLGVADGQLSAAEVEEYIEAQGPAFENQTDQSEKTKRMVRIVGQIGPEESDIPPTLTGRAKFWDKYPTRMSFSEDKAAMFFWFVYNRSAATITTGATVKLTLLHNIRWAA